MKSKQNESEKRKSKCHTLTNTVVGNKQHFTGTSYNFPKKAEAEMTYHKPSAGDVSDMKWSRSTHESRAKNPRRNGSNKVIQWSSRSKTRTFAERKGPSFFCEDDQSDLSVYRSFHLLWISVPFTWLAVMMAQNLACHARQRSIVWGSTRTCITTQNSPVHLKTMRVLGGSSQLVSG